MLSIPNPNISFILAQSHLHSARLAYRSMIEQDTSKLNHLQEALGSKGGSTKSSPLRLEVSPDMEMTNDRRARVIPGIEHTCLLCSDALKDIITSSSLPSGSRGVEQVQPQSPYNCRR